MSKKDLKQAEKRISEITTEINKLVTEATHLADETGAEFSLSIAYGMGGTYKPSLAKAGQWTQDAKDNYWDLKEEDGHYEWDSYHIDEDGGWYTSSMSC